MSALTLSPLSLIGWPFQSGSTKRNAPVDVDERERRQVVGEMIAAGACDSEYGVQMLMSVFPERF